MYAFARFEVYQGLVDVSILIAVAVTGVLMLLLTGLGYIGILDLRKKLLAVYLCTLFVFSIVVLAFGVIFVSYVMGLEATATGINMIDQGQASTGKWWPGQHRGQGQDCGKAQGHAMLGK